jgi:membrane-bound lytic murein transglycosylase B
MAIRIGAASAFIMVTLLGLPITATAQPNCHNTGSFETWLADFKKEAQTKGISAEFH